MPNPKRPHEIANSIMDHLRRIARDEGELDETIWSSITRTDDCRRQDPNDRQSMDRCYDLCLALLRQLSTEPSLADEAPRYMEGCVRMLQGAILLDRGRLDEVASCFDQASQCFRDGSSQRSAALASLALGELYELKHQRQDAMTAYRRGWLSLKDLDPPDRTTMTLKDSLQKRLNGVIDQILQPQGASPAPTAYLIALGVLPIVGEIGAGKPVPASDDIDRYGIAKVVTVDDTDYAVHPMIKGRRAAPDFHLDFLYFATPVIGDSMTGISIMEGDYVVLRRPRNLPVRPDPGDIVAVVISDADDRAILKRYERQGKQIILESENPEHEPLYFKEGDERLMFVAIAIAVLKKVD